MINTYARAVGGLTYVYIKADTFHDFYPHVSILKETLQLEHHSYHA